MDTSKGLLDNLEITPVKMYGHRGKRIAFFGDIFNPRSNKEGNYTISDVVLKEYTEDDMFKPDVEPPFTMSTPATQKLFQDLWDLGFRPSSEEGNIGALAATKDHLADMRKIAFSGLSEMEKKLNPSYLIIGSSGNGQEEIEES